jgi:hypothetical protein
MSCGTASYARGIQYRLSVRVSLLLRGLNNYLLLMLLYILDLILLNADIYYSINKKCRVETLHILGS